MAVLHKLFRYFVFRLAVVRFCSDPEEISQKIHLTRDETLKISTLEFSTFHPEL